jgi:chemotaxis protein MotB
MSKDPFSKLQSSLSLEDLLAQPSIRNSQNWLLTYLDVFILVVMLVITLITLSDINTEQAAANKPQATKPKKAPACPPVVTPTPTTCPPPVVAGNSPMQQIAPTENKSGIGPDNSNTKTDSKESISIATIKTPEIKNAPETGESTIPEAPDAKQAVDNTPADKKKLQQQLTKTIDELGLNKAINLKIAQDYAQLEIQDNVLFKSSEADLTASGGALLKHLTPVLKQAVGLILIEGHTDNIPIKTAQFPSNWELGASRATSVLHFLVLQQLDSSRLRAITYADTMPIADNSTPEGREKNRRVNILIKFSEQ